MNKGIIKQDALPILRQIRSWHRAMCVQETYVLCRATAVRVKQYSGELSTVAHLLTRDDFVEFSQRLLRVTDRHGSLLKYMLEINAWIMKIFADPAADVGEFDTARSLSEMKSRYDELSGFVGALRGMFADLVVTHPDHEILSGRWRLMIMSLPGHDTLAVDWLLNKEREWLDADTSSRDRLLEMDAYLSDGLYDASLTDGYTAYTDFMESSVELADGAEQVIVELTDGGRKGNWDEIERIRKAKMCFKSVSERFQAGEYRAELIREAMDARADLVEALESFIVSQ